MKILLATNSMQTSTGYGTQGAKLTRMFQELGHEVGYQSFWGVIGAKLNIEGVPHYSPLRDVWGQDLIGRTVQHFKADCVLVLADAWVLSDGFQDKAGVPVILYSPIDSEPAAPRSVAVMRQSRYPTVFSKFGLEETRKAGLKCSYVPHVIDADVFQPGDKKEARRLLGLPEDGFMVAMVAANKAFPSRKAFPEQLTAYAGFKAAHSDAFLYLHTFRAPIGSWADGIHFDPLLENLGIAKRGAVNDVFITDEFLLGQNIFDEYWVAKVYQAADVLLHASYAEGFGLCIAEAQACGTPVITNNFSSMPELSFDKELMVEPAQRFWSLANCWQTIPAVSEVQAALELVYQEQARFTERAAERVAFIRDNYGWDVVKPQWEALLNTVGDEVEMVKGAAAD